MDAPVLLSDVIDFLDHRYPPSTAESWDVVGLVTGDPDQPVQRVLFAVDPTIDVVAEAIQIGAQLLVTHHPLLLEPVHSIAATNATGRILAKLSAAGIALYVAHTNAAIAPTGVSEALAEALDLAEIRPLVPTAEPALDVLVAYVPEDDAATLRSALARAGAGAVGDYSGCGWSVSGLGEFTPGDGADPTIGVVGTHEQVRERRLEMVVPPQLRTDVVAALRAAHPYEEPAFSFLPTQPIPGRSGHGRLGHVRPEMTLADFARQVSAALPVTAQGIRISGDPDRRINTVAVCSGAGAQFLPAASTAGADAFLTSDLPHHRVRAARADAGAPALIDAAHGAGQWPWLPVASRTLAADARGRVEVIVSTSSTDPWTRHQR